MCTYCNDQVFAKALSATDHENAAALEAHGIEHSRPKGVTCWQVIVVLVLAMWAVLALLVFGKP